MSKNIALLLLFVATTACSPDDYFGSRTSGTTTTTTTLDVEVVIEEDGDGDFSDWSDDTHSKSVDPNYDIVFAQGEVLRLDIKISEANWTAMWNDLSNNLGYSNNMAGGITNSSLDFTPVFVPSTITYNGTDWYKVGIRFKGNSSLSETYYSGNKKFSFKLDFDEFEDYFPDLKNQRFYGFKQLNLNNNYEDYSFLREKVAEDLFREFGLVAANTSFCEVYVDYGEGSQYFGLYTIVEEVDDTVIETQFGNDSGALYKPEDDAASFAYGTYDTDEFYLKSDYSDYSDVLALYNALHSSNRTSEPEAWKAQLESVFDVDTFLKWLAVTTTIQNWDAYGNMAHNYYLYNNPSNGLLTWIPWDHNEAFQDGKGNYTTYNPSELSRISSSWPLISYLWDVEEYQAIFDSYIEEFVTDIFSVSKMTAAYTSYYSLLQSYAYAEEKGFTFLSSSGQFDSAVSTLKTHVQSRVSVVNSYLK
ncbi:MAG: CotH kinase family protein [Rikenellaceae bacterium]